MGDDRATRVLAVLLGASTFPNAPKLAAGRAFYLSADEVQVYLSDVGGMALPRRNILSLFDDSRSPSDQLVEVASFLLRRTLELKTEGVRAEDLLIYYVGHGLFTRGDHAYCFAVRSTNEINEGASSIRAGDLAGVIKENAAFLRRYLILDCCFAASIHKEFQSGALSAARVQIASEFPERGTALLCSSNAREPSLAPKGLNYTMFSSALIQALRQGREGAGPQLSFSELGELIKENLRHAYPEGWVRPEVHSPDQREGDIAQIPLFPNPAYRGHESPEEKRREADERNQAGAERTWTAREAEQERLARTQAEQERLAQERLAREQAEQERLAQERLARKQAEQERLANERADAERAEATRRAEQELVERKQAASGGTLRRIAPAALFVAVAGGGLAWLISSGPQPQPSNPSDTTQQSPARQTGSDAPSNQPTRSQTTNGQTSPKASDASDAIARDQQRIVDVLARSKSQSPAEAVATLQNLQREFPNDNRIAQGLSSARTRIGSTAGGNQRTGIPPPADEKPAILKVLNDFAAAYNAKNTAGLQAVWPGVGSTFRDTFSSFRDLNWRYQKQDVTWALSGSDAGTGRAGAAALEAIATATCIVSISQTTVRDRRTEETRTKEFKLEKSAGVWRIVSYRDTTR